MSDLNPIEHVWKDLKMAVHRRFPSNLMELERYCKEEWEKLTKNRSAKLVASYSKRLEAVIAAKGASTKYCAKTEYLCTSYIFVLNFCKSITRNETNFFQFLIMGYCM